MNKILKIGTIMLTLSILVSMMVMPAIAWGDITHESIDAKLTNVPSVIKENPMFTKGGGTGPDMFFFASGKENYSILAHTINTADLGRKMLSLASSHQDHAYAYGWLSHDASDIIGHRDYVNPIAGTDMTLHSKVEIGVDANLVDITPTSFSVPYLLVQNAYKATYGDTNIPSYGTIVNAAKTEATIIYIEKVLIKWGLFNDLKNQYNDFWPQYKDSINYSIYVINDPEKLPNVNLFTGFIDTSNVDVGTSITSVYNNIAVPQIDSDIVVASKEMIDTGVIDVDVKHDKEHHYITIDEPTIKNKKAFNDKMTKLVMKMKTKMNTK